MTPHPPFRSRNEWLKGSCRGGIVPVSFLLGRINAVPVQLQGDHHNSERTQWIEKADFSPRGIITSVTLDRFKHIAIRSSQVLLILFPLLLAAIVQIREVVGMSSSNPFLVTIPLALSLIVFFIYLTQNQTAGRIKQIIEALIVLGIIISIRLVLLAIFSSRIESDFWDIHRFAVDLATGQGSANIMDYTFIPRVSYLNMTSIFLSFFYRLLGTDIRVGKLIMVGLSGLTGLTIYATAKKTWNNHAAGLVAALIFAFWPSLVVYTGMTTPDHIAMLLICLVFFTLLSIEDTGTGVNAFIPLFVLLGILCGWVDWFRPVGIVLVIAIILSDLFISGWRNRHHWLLLGCRIVSFFLIYTLVSNLSITISEELFNIQLPANNQGIGESLYIGLNPKTGGMFSQEDYAYITANQRTFGNNFTAANRLMVEKALERISTHRDQILQLMLSKFNRVWSNHDQLFEFALNGSNDQELAGYLKILDALLTPMIAIGTMVSICSSFFMRISRGVFSMQLFILGLGLLLLVTEVQNRYHLVLVPVLVILAAHGFRCLAGWLIKFTAAIQQPRPNSTRTMEQK